MVEIWYLLHCQKQNEWEILDSLRRKLSKAALKAAFVFTYDRMRKFEGEWHLEKRLMFPAYVFLESEDEKALAEEMKQYESIAVLLKERKTMLHIHEQEERFFMSLCGNTHHLGMSKGVIKNGTTRITEGPLKGLEKKICRIDRHKRLARLETPEGFAAGSIVAGLEIMEKG